MPASAQVVSGLRTFAKDVADGFIEITHNGFALLGLAVAFAAILLISRPDLRHSGEAQLRDWLQARQVATLGTPVEPDAVERATATNPTELPKEQAAVAYWLSKKYRVAAEPLAVLVSEAYELGERNQLDPTLILAIMAIESSFNPFAQSSVGAQGLMQVMTRVHTDKYEHFGGQLAAFDPVSNLRVGVKVLKECIARAGSLEGGLRYYVGAANLPNDGGYASKVLAEHARIRQIAGRPAPAAAPAKPALVAKEAAPSTVAAADVVADGKLLVN
ncbi:MULTISPECIES: lytic transglycosylase domain-containing protein [Comamonas]|jgi:soluble lytic murein transglycosylase-like protein|uniref:Lytic transglycosylase n=1 Tax=Comamonas terrigena TaxID=32013 RepID=A0A2A7UYF3_COMTR|nr:MULTISPECIES: lytic transglycosylase domain-containing protein [Comamonas]MBD9534072.1 lytic transglycosylase domain-containing protein [Comamonas sp. CMM01]MBV7416906.1 lytic transglycosylase domain-containing protein [Comamonas sp. CMM03]MDH0050957.1 lytic transglycosylase domain-containing protein [Comamonas terrigena]MDH0511365.1 lytic transglycosylase domain-containing protein [Comamonas terrigena]MDH1091332.1 lytic transglycosylase domain-containing protein [Comamonas terrigena]